MGAYAVGSGHSHPDFGFFGAIRLGQQLPEVNAVVSIVIALTIIPVLVAARVAGAGAVARSAAAQAAQAAQAALAAGVH